MNATEMMPQIQECSRDISWELCGFIFSLVTRVFHDIFRSPQPYEVSCDLIYVVMYMNIISVFGISPFVVYEKC